MTYNPLFDYVPVERSFVEQWADVVDSVSGFIDRAIRRGDVKTSFKFLNVMDLIDIETAIWFREYGFYLLGSGGNEKEQVETPDCASVDSAIS